MIRGLGKIGRAFAVVVATSLLAAPAAADPVAEALYDEGVKKLKARDFDEACTKLAASFEREELSGTLMTLGQCEQLRGRTATAWGHFRKAATMAHNEGRDAYAKKARELSDALEPKLTRLQIEAESTVEVAVDGEPLGAASYGLALPLDPGPHTVRARAEGFQPWSTTIELKGRGETLTVQVPPLEPAPEGTPPDPAPHEATPAAPTTPDVEGADGGIPAWAWIGGGVGVASLAASGVFLGLFLDTKSELDDRCGETRQMGECDTADGTVPSDLLALSDDEKRNNVLYAVFGAVGIVGVGVGITGIILGAMDDDAPAAAAWIPSVATDGRSTVLSWQGQF